MVTQSIYFLYRSFLAILLLNFVDIQADLEHVCANSNESVLKFRKSMSSLNKKEAINICLAEKITTKHIPHFEWPIDLCNFWISSLFGQRTLKGITKMHHGIDMAALKGTEVKAAADGKVVIADTAAPGYGTLVEIEHKHRFTTRYGHMEEIFVAVGDQVKQGDLIGTVGSSGHVHAKKDPSHLHFEIRQYGHSLNPLKYLYCSEVIFVEQ